MAFKVLQSKLVYHGRVFDVRHDHLLLPDGGTTQLDLIIHRPAVTMVPIDEHGRIWFVHQYRHPAENTLMELPAGVMEANETPEASAQREIQEEIGMAADSLIKIGEFYLAPGYSSEFMYIFLASGLHPNPLPRDVGEFLSIDKITARQAMQLAETNQIRDSKSLAALFLARPHLESLGIL